MSIVGKVISIDNDIANIEVKSSSECKGCCACSKGTISKDSKIIKARIVEIRPEVGSFVMLDTSSGSGAIIAVLIFGLPMIFFITGILSAKYLPAYLIKFDIETIQIFFGFTLMSIYYIILAIVAKINLLKSLNLKIIKILNG